MQQTGCGRDLKPTESMRIATFNVQNMRLRTRGGVARLDGARDGDVPEDAGAAAAGLDPADRDLTAAVIERADADVVALQEVFDRATLDHFHDRVLVPTGIRPYPHRVCLPGNDGRGLDIAVMSRLPLRSVASHAGETPSSLGLEPVEGVGAADRIFRRDCLEVAIGELTLFVCHFKAPGPDHATTWPVRRLEAAAVRKLVERRFAAPGDALWLVIGDLNEQRHAPPGRERAIAPILNGFSVDLLLRLPADERWSYQPPDSIHYSRPDALLASPELARRWPDAIPRILRSGLGREIEGYRGERLSAVGRHRPHASDHAAIVIDFSDL